MAQRLARKGFRVLLRNVRTPAGEVDIVAERLGVLYFVEVKARTLGGPAGRPEEALTPRKLARVANAADSILRRRGLSEAPRRLLGAAVDLDPSGAPVDVRLVPVEEIR